MNCETWRSASNFTRYHWLTKVRASDSSSEGGLCMVCLMSTAVSPSPRWWCPPLQPERAGRPLRLRAAAGDRGGEVGESNPR